MSPGPMHGHGRNRGTGEKADDFRLAWRRLFEYMGRYRVPFLVALVVACAGTVLTLAGPNLISDVTDLIEAGLPSLDPATGQWVLGEMDLDAIVSMCLLLVAIYAVSAVLTFVQQYIMTTISQRTASNFRRDISVKINRLPLRYFDTSTTGDVMSRVTNDVDTLGQSMNQSISTMVTAITLLAGSVVMMLYTDMTLAATAILSSLVGFAFMAVVMSRSQKYFDRQQQDLGEMNGHVEEMYSGHLVMKAYGGEASAKAEFDRINESLFRSGFRSQFLGGLMMPFMNFIGNFGYVMVCIVGALLCIDGRISFGVIVAFMIYVRLFTQPLTQISQAVVSMQSVAAAAERVFGFLDEPEMEDESGKEVRLDHVEGHVEFRDVHFGYSPDREIIHGFSAEVLPGQKVAIVGPTGAGKTTMVNLLMRFYEVDSGDILIDGVSTRDMRREAVHDLFCMVLQDTWLFEGTLRENLVYSKEGVSDERLDEVCKAVGLYHYVKTLPEGYDTVIGDSSEMSAGQRQQVTIARAMIEDAPLLILDEATSSVDTRTERVIQEAMDRLTENRTSFVIAHRLSTIRNSDLILVMRDGNIIEQGTHDQLLAAGGFYAELYNSQFDPEDERSRRPSPERNRGPSGGRPPAETDRHALAWHGIGPFRGRPGTVPGVYFLCLTPLGTLPVTKMEAMTAVAFVIYFIALILIGVHFWRTKDRDSMEDYILGGRSFGPYVSAMSAQASDMSGWLLMGLPGSIVLAGLGQAWIGIGLLIGSYTSWLFVAKRLRKHSVVSKNSLTMPEFFSNRFGDHKGYLRIICAVIILFFFTIYVGSGFQSCGIVMEMLLENSGMQIGIIVGGAVIILYTFLGGYKALCWTDFFQAILMVIVIVMVPLVIIGQTGWDTITAGWDTIMDTQVPGYTSLFYNAGVPISAVVIISGLVWGLGYYGMPHIVVRYMSIRKVSEIKVARRVSLIWGILALGFICLLAVVAGVYLPAHGVDILSMTSKEAEFVFMYTAQQLFETTAPFILGVVFAAILAAIMSTASSQLLVSASSVTNDILAKSERVHISQRNLMWLARGIVVVISIIGMCLALFGNDNIMGLVSYAWSGFGSAFSPVMILALFWKRMNWQGAMAAMITGFVVVVFWETFMDFTGMYSLFPGFIAAFIVGVVVAKLTPPPSKEVTDEYDAAQAYVDPED